MLKNILKSIIPRDLHSFIRKECIKKKHRKVAAMLGVLGHSCKYPWLIFVV